MTLAELGNYSLAFATIAACAAIGSAIVSRRFDSANMLWVARASIHWMTGVLTFSCVVLLVAICRDDFSLEYVANYSQKSLSRGYKIAAFWAGPQGSLLLWAWMLAVMASIAAFLGRKDAPDRQAATLAILAAACVIFPIVMLFITDVMPLEGTDEIIYRPASPFHLADVVKPDGRGMRPQLQDPAMIAHPPLLFLGYAGLTIPFAIGFGSLISGRKDTAWIGPARRWMVASWLFLTAGIVLGCEWAYVEHGWGGYWSWDRVENASLLPWFTATAAMHSLMIQQRRGMCKYWAASLLAMSYVLCIVATFVTRGGALESKHAFGSSGTVASGWFFLGVIGAGILGSVGVMIWRRRLLSRGRRLDRIVSHETSVLAANVLLTGMMLVTLVGTFFPVITRFINNHIRPRVKDISWLADRVPDESMVVGPEFYNKIVLPMFLVLILLMGICLALQFAKNRRELRRRLLIPLIAMCAALVVMISYRIRLWGLDILGIHIEGLHESTHDQRVAFCWLTAAVMGVVLVVAAVFDDVIRAITLRLRSRQQSALATIGQTMRANLRRYGGLITHLGVVMFMIGVAASSLYSSDEVILEYGESEKLGERTLRFDSRETVEGPNYIATEAGVTVIEPDGTESVLRPQLRFYEGFEQHPNTQVAIRTSLREDLYIAAGLGRKDGVPVVYVTAQIKPMVLWLWIGSIAMLVGSLLSLVSGRRKAAQGVEPDDPETEEEQ